MCVRLVEEYNCAKNAWLVRLFRLKEKWCTTYCKDVFSDGILSSQRSELTNASLSRRVNATCGLFDFHNIFFDIVTEWRIKEKDENVKNKDGFLEMYLRHLAFYSMLRKSIRTTCTKFLRRNALKEKGILKIFLA